VTASFGENTNAATLVQLLENGRVDFALIDMRSDLELCAFEALGQRSIGLFVLNVLTSQLTQGDITAEGLLGSP
jgi:hypothetical protein